MLFKTEFYKEIETEFKIIVEKERLTSEGNPLTNLSTQMFYLTKHQFDSVHEFDDAVVSEIANTLQSLEDAVVKRAIAYGNLAKDVYNQNVDIQKWVDYAQEEARILSYELYSDDEIKYLRRFHIVWLTWVYCDEELKKLRIRSSRDLYNHIGKAQKEYVKKRSEELRHFSTNKDKY